MKAIVVDELQEAMKNALVDAWKEVEGLKRKAESDRLIKEAEDFLKATEQRRKVWEILNETTSYS